MNCASMTTDYEPAMWKSLKELYPTIRFLKCWFHFTQAAKKRAMQTPQLIPHLRRNPAGKEIYYKLLSLPLLPADKIINEFKTLKTLALANNQVFDKFIAYYEKQWVKKEGPEAISVFNMWTRTTGTLERYNGVLGQRILKRGSFFKFVKILIEEEFRHCRDFYSLLRGRDDKAVTKGNKYQIRGAKIKRNSELLLEDRITPEQFLSRIVYN